MKKTAGMREKKTLRNIAVALCVFVLWGNLISLLLPADQYGAVIKTVDFSTVLFLLAILITAIYGIRKDRKEAGQASPDD